MSSIHTTWGYVAVVISGVVGLWGILMAKRDQVPVSFWWGVGVAVTALLLEVIVGAYLLSEGGDPGDQHTFYGVLIPVTFSFAYIYRSQMRQRPALRYGLLLLFSMGLGIRGIMTFGQNF